MLNDAVRNGMPIPARFANRPVIGEGEAFYFNAYQHLATCRAYETAFIPWTAIMLYGQTYGLDAEEIDDLVTVVLAVDTVTVARLRKSHTEQTGLKGKRNAKNTP